MCHARMVAQSPKFEPLKSTPSATATKGVIIPTLIINTPTRKGGDTDEGRIRAAAVTSRTPLIGTLTGAQAAVQAIAALRAGTWTVHALQDHFPASEEAELSASS